MDTREVKDAAKLQQYGARVAPVIEKFGGRIVVRGGAFEVVEGAYQPTRLVLLEFPSMD